MPIKRVQFPDGSIKRIEVPEGATNDQIIAFVQSQQPGNDLTMPDGSSATAAGQRAIEDARFYKRNLPTNGMTNGQLALAGVGKVFADTGRGVQQLLGRRSQADVDFDRQLDAPLMNTPAGTAGYIGGQAAAMSVPVGDAANVLNFAGKAAPYLGAGLRAGAFQATQPVGTGETRAGNAAEATLAGVAGQGIAAGLNTVARGAVMHLDAPARALAQKASQRGFRVGLPQLSDNAFVRTVASQMDRLPFSGAGKRIRANQETFNRQVGASFGAPEARITPDVFAGAKQRIGNVFDTLSNRNTLRPDGTMQQNIMDVINESARLGNSDHARLVKNWAQELASKADAQGNIPGAAYKSWHSRVGKMMASGGDQAMWLGTLRDAVAGGMDRSISAADQAAWRLARQQYANLKTVEPLVAKSVKGDISPAGLMGRVNSNGAGKVRMATGRAGDLGDLARIGQSFLKEAPNSGTADRLLVNAGLLGGVGAAQQQGWISPEHAAEIGGLLLLNRVGGKVLNSRALAMGESRALKGLARAAKPAPRLLPAAIPAAKGLLMVDPNEPDNILPLLQGY